MTGAAANLVSTAPADPDAIWSAVGQPLSKMGAGRYRLTGKYLFFEKSGLRTDAQQVPVASIVDVDVKQSLTQKSRGGLGTVLVHVQRGERVEVVQMVDIPDPRGAQNVINETAHEARLAVQRNQNTMRYEGTHPTAAATPQPAQAPAAAPAAVVDPIAQLEQLARLRDAGVLTDEEFAAKKADILSRM